MKLDSKKIVMIIGGIAVLAFAPPNFQIVSVILVIMLSVVAMIPATRELNDVPRERLSPTDVSRPDPSLTADLFDDARVAIDLFKSALERFDPHRTSQIAAILDDCVQKYLDAISRDPGYEAAWRIDAHMIHREEIRKMMAETYVTTDGDPGVTEVLDSAVASIDSLFASFDKVFHMGGYTARPGPVPAN